jgi:hypothetical protein
MAKIGQIAGFQCSAFLSSLSISVVEYIVTVVTAAADQVSSQREM